VLVSKEIAVFIFLFAAMGFISPARRTTWLTGSALSDDSQFFATATCICPNLPEVCPANHY